MTNTISGKQCALFCSIMILSTKLLSLPSLLYSTNTTAGIFSVFFIFFLEFIFLVFLIKIKKKNKNKLFFNYFELKIGKIFTKIFFCILLLFFLLKTLYVLEESFSFLKRCLYNEASIAVFLVCVLPPITAFAYKGLKAFGRTLEIFYLVIISLVVLCLVVSLFSTSNLAFGILSSSNFNVFWEATFKYSFWFGDFLFLIVILDKVKLDKNSTKQILGYSIFSFVLVLLLYAIYFITFQTTSFSHPFAILDIIQFISEFGTVGKFDIIPITAYMFLIYFQLGMFFFCAKSCMQKVLPFGHEAQPLVALNIFFIIFAYLTLNNTTGTSVFFSDIFRYFALFFVYAIPIIFIILGILQNKRGGK